jgi:O-antigen ligase
MVTAIIGLGPGETLDSYFEVGKGKWASSLLGSASHNQFSLTLLELGFSGALISMYMMVWLAYGFVKIYRSIPPAENRELICGLFGTAMVFMVCVLYMNVIFVTDATSFLFWICAAYLSVSMNKINLTVHHIQGNKL